MLAEARSNLRGFAAICRKAAEIGWPAHYLDDLYVHDLNKLAAADDTQFAWAVRSTGTWLFLPGETDEILSYVTAFEAQDHRAFWWDGKTLFEIPVSAIRANLDIVEGAKVEAAP